MSHSQFERLYNIGELARTLAEAFTASANHTFLAGVEGALENDDPAVRRIYQVPMAEMGMGWVFFYGGFST